MPLHAAKPEALNRFIDEQGVIILDGGLATALEERGHDLHDPLWSAKILIEAPEAIRDLHRDYLIAGADCTTTATYQASLAGFRNRGLSEEEGADLLRLAVRMAAAGRDDFWAEAANRRGRLFPLIAASIGPYGAFLADGAEYRGDYAITDNELYDFHRGRWQVLADGEADLLACETIPSGPEARVLLRLLRETPQRQAWLSFSCRDGSRLCDGTPLQDVLRDCAEVPNLVAVGINCTAPAHVTGLLAAAHGITDKTLIVYPNLGERYDGVTKTWGAGPSPQEWLTAAAGWVAQGAAGVGGCCRIGPEMIGRLRQRLLGEKKRNAGGRQT